MRRIMLKEGPLVFLRNVLSMEALACLIFYLLSFLTNYSLIYGTINFSKYIRFDIFEILVFSLFQLVYITVLFLNWYFSYYEIHDKEIIKKTGILFRRRKSVRLSDVATVEVYQSPLSRMMNHATIILEHNNGRYTRLKNIANYPEYLHIIKQMVHNASGRIPTRDAKILIKDGEGLYTEFKETMRYDGKRGEASKDLEKVIAKTMVGFMNASGGTLIIGVNDQGLVTGIENDYKTLPKKNRDGFENHINMIVKTMIGLTFAKYISVTFNEIDGKDICLITVYEGHKPAYLQNGDKKEEFYVRVGNSTQPYSMSEAEEYIKSRWR